MTKQCGNCKWWDRDNSVIQINRGIKNADCLYELVLPKSIDVHDASFYKMFDTEGQDCPVYEERKG